MIGIIGINHNTASVEIRERYALSETEAIALVDTWKQDNDIEGAIVLSTCNRIEIYYETSQEHFRPYILIRKLSKFKNVDNVDESIFLCKQGNEAFGHLFRLASGLESMVRGETQILGQLKNAFRVATESRQTTSILSRLFHKAFETAKLIRTRHFVSSIPISSGATAVQFLSQKVEERTNLITLIVGAGQIAETICDELQRKGCRDIRIYNRTRERAERFAQTHGNIHCYFEEQLEQALSCADVVFVATSSLTPIVTPDILSQHPDNKCYFFDMAVPRNIAEDVALLPWAEVYTIDDLRHFSPQDSFDDIDWESIEALVQEMISQIEEWINASALREVIHTIQEASNVLLEKELSKLPNQMDEYDKKRIAHYEQHLRITFSTALVAASRKVTQEGRNLKYAEVIGKLFKEIIEENL